MTTAIIGTGGLGTVIARQLAAGGETLRLSSADHGSARTLRLSRLNGTGASRCSTCALPPGQAVTEFRDAFTTARSE